MEIVVYDDAAAAVRAAAERLAAAAEAGGHLALSGGSTPRPAYALAAAADWSRARVWFADDRAVPPGDERSNYRLVREALLDRLAAPPAGVHRIRGELGAEEAAALYDRELEGVTIDLALLGVGPDGHTASLFPGSPALSAGDRRAVAASPGHEPFVERVTMTVSTLRSARAIVYLVAGTGKAVAVRDAFGREDPAVPAGVVRSARGSTDAILDRAAAALLGV